MRPDIDVDQQITSTTGIRTSRRRPVDDPPEVLRRVREHLCDRPEHAPGLGADLAPVGLVGPPRPLGREGARTRERPGSVPTSASAAVRSSIPSNVTSIRRRADGRPAPSRRAGRSRRTRSEPGTHRSGLSERFSTATSPWTPCALVMRPTATVGSDTSVLEVDADRQPLARRGRTHDRSDRLRGAAAAADHLARARRDRPSRDTWGHARRRTPSPARRRDRRRAHHTGTRRAPSPQASAVSSVVTPRLRPCSARLGRRLSARRLGSGRGCGRAAAGRRGLAPPWPAPSSTSSPWPGARASCSPRRPSGARPRSRPRCRPSASGCAPGRRAGRRRGASAGHGPDRSRSRRGR